MADPIEVINEHFYPYGEIIVREAKRAGLDLALACALVEQEGGRNIFGCDWGPRWTFEPPYCQVPVTPERVRRLLANIDSGGGSNGVGLTQLTYPPYIREAEALGGAHLPRYQCRVGFRLLKELIEQMGERQGIGAYNGGQSNPVMEYATSVMIRKRQWSRRLGESTAVVNEWHPGMGDSLAPPGFRPKRRVIGSPNYVLDHPTRYRWQKHIEPLIRKLYRRMDGPLGIHINTYLWHPPYDPPDITRRYDTLSFDVWGPRGRGDPIGYKKGQKAFDIIWNDPGLPWIEWIIWQRTIRWRGDDFTPRPFGSNPFSWHEDHVHVTFLKRS